MDLSGECGEEGRRHRYGPGSEQGDKDSKGQIIDGLSLGR